MQHVLAVDQGTSGTKAVVVDASGAVLSSAEVAHAPRHLPGGGVEHDPEQLWDAVVATGRRALAAAGLPVGAVGAVALANQGETVLAWDRDTGRPLSQAVVWQDRRAVTVTDPLRAQGYAEPLARRTGLVLDPYFSAPKLRWLRDHVTSEGVVTTTDAWLVHRMCGAFVTDVSTAGRSLLTALEDPTRWDADLLATFGLADEPVPAIVAGDDVVGATDVFGPTLAVTGLVVDQQAALLAQGCWEAGTAKCTFGTGAFLLVQTGTTPVLSPGGLTTSAAWRLRDETRFCVDGQVYTAASAVDWLAGLGVLGSAAEIDAVAAPDAGGVQFVPALTGLAAPWWQPDAAASLTGLRLGTGRAEVVRAVVEGVAASVAHLLAVVRAEGTEVRSLRVDGGLTRSDVLVQALADRTQVPVERHRSEHTTAVGAAVAAHLALDPDLTPAAALPQGDSPSPVLPRWSPERAEAEGARWSAAAQAVADAPTTPTPEVR
ncbi:FGGY family carbohydrate kinase [Nocardioides zeae]|uniref:ATP:glycerol 3-phosphotransferase n=1 Tax=Nocardioides imazamoxiresistens TaxID=3231893 RepID=A0ABU3PVW2_9ACTN|nr:FGGY family carbohydrate kinase [Nocardioides zeae]MDT9593016.1 FGGY family carbohydrate kinase [Nocardioides zeae]